MITYISTVLTATSIITTLADMYKKHSEKQQEKIELGGKVYDALLKYSDYIYDSIEKITYEDVITYEWFI